MRPFITKKINMNNETPNPGGQQSGTTNPNEGTPKPDTSTQQGEQGNNETQTQDGSASGTADTENGNTGTTSGDDD